MIQKIYLIVILVFFILAFAIRNIKTYLSTKKSIRGSSPKLTLSVLLSTIIYVLILLRLTVLGPDWFLQVNLDAYYPYLNKIGLGLVSIGFVLGILALIAMKDSWRVGIKYDQITKLIDTGIYRVSRNPYFFSYDILILGYLLIFPSLVLLLLYTPLVVVFHYMILEEEKYLEGVHNMDYLNYKSKVKRYFLIF